MILRISSNWKQGTTTLVVDTVTKVQDGRTSANTFTWQPTATSYVSSYRVDAVGRIVRAQIPGKVIDYNYVASSCAAAPNAYKNSNRSSMVVTPTSGVAVTSSYCYDNADRLALPTAGVGTLGYDSRGNTTAVNSDVYTFDGANRHTRTVSGATTVDYVRDATNRIVDFGRFSGSKHRAVHQ